MLEAKTMTKIEAILGFEGGALKAAIESDDSKELEIPKGKLYDSETHVIKTNEDHEIFVGNIKTENKTAGVEIAVKEFKRENNLEFEGKTIDNLIKASNAKALKDANIEPDKKMEGYLLDIEALQGKNKTLTGDLAAEVEKGAKRDVKIKDDKSITDHMKGDYTLSSDRMLGIFNAEHTLGSENGVQVVLKGGEIMKDENRSPLGLGAVMEGFTKEFSKTPEGGTGAGNQGGAGGSGNIDAFNKRQEAAGNNVGSEAYMKAHATAIADSTLTV